MEQHSKSIGEYIAALKRRFTVALISFVAVFVTGVYVAYSLPATYRSTGTILIEQQNISTDFVQSTLPNYAQELDRVQRRVMSSSSLTPIIEKYGLYPDSVAGDPTFQSAADALRADTLLTPENTPVPRGNGETTIAFTLSFDHRNAATAHQVATELANLYVKQNVESRTNQAQATVDFLQLEIENARAEVSRTSDELARFKERHAGNLPELLNFHLQSIDRTEQQIDQLDRDIRDSRSRKFTVETELATTNPFGNAVDANGDPILGTADRLALLNNERLRLLSIYTPAHPAVIQVERELQMLTGGSSQATGAETNSTALRTQLNTVLTELQQARQTYSEDHPDVVRLSRSAAVLQQQLEQAVSPESSRQSSIATLASRDPVVQQLRQQVDTEQAFLASLQTRRTELENKLDDLRSRVAAMPQIERDYAQIVQQNELALQRYNAAIGQLDTAQRAQTLETEGGGERFTLLEAPLLPQEPFAPKRSAIVMLAFVLALGIAIGLAMVIDHLDETVKGWSELAQFTGAPPLAVIPLLENRADRRRRLAKTVAKSAFFVSGMATAYGIAISMSG
jgi:uncharacterized protein involved in exopolysaccharide biosynthesis